MDILQAASTFTEHVLGHETRVSLKKQIITSDIMCKDTLGYCWAFVFWVFFWTTFVKI